MEDKSLKALNAYAWAPLGSCLSTDVQGMALMLKARSLESLAKGWKPNLLRLSMLMHGLPWIPVWALMVKAWP